MANRKFIPIEELSLEQAKKELSFLQHEISYHDDLYYQHSQSKILDFEYDQLKERCDSIARAFPEFASLADSNGPLNKIGGEKNLSLFKITHSPPMRSLEKGWKIENINNFMTKIYRDLKKDCDNSIVFTLEPKIDGASLSIRYEQGKFVHAALRGDGYIGEDVSANISMMSIIPQVLSFKVPEIFEVRGEVYISKKDFFVLNEEIMTTKKKLYATPRNAVSGLLRSLNPTSKSIVSRYLKFFVHGIGTISEEFADGQYEMLQKMRALGFPVNERIQQAHTLEGIISYYDETALIRYSLPYDIDGVVYKVDSFTLQQQLGERSRSPIWAISHKFSDKAFSTRLLGIDIQIGRTGILTPIARFESINIGGVFVSNATLHNENYIKGLDSFGKIIRGGRDIRIGDMILVKRSGDVIPKVADVIMIEERPIDSQMFSFPSSCPVCQSQVVRAVNPKTGKLGSSHYCTGGLMCPAQQLEYLKYFVSRDAFNIEGLGEKQLDFFFKSEDPSFSIRIPADIFTLQHRQQTSFKKLENIPGFAHVSVTNLYDAINKRRNISLQRFIFSLGIHHVGIEIARSLAQFYRSYQNFETEIKNILDKKNDADVSLKKVALVGDMVAQSIIAFYQNPDNNRAVAALLNEISLSVWDSQEDNSRNSILANKRVVFTGTLQTITRHQAQEAVKQLGAITSSTISHKTHIVVVGDNAGSKLNKARQLGIEIMNEEQFLSLIPEQIKMSSVTRNDTILDQ
ncbi:NAD-dependent DNA ligase LigA [Candidatus Liberibacter solanacearum]|uniref:DNA ligase n=1 Tax=Candidatus Liberibacter solanacearum TaxID=556287 RepID=A0A424FLV3_9HYPH|nr:NAD-dependent DNA ligase LigA [Candidatus Liberibacter solanacearum]RPD37122.1 NAD-dependent DNA ligase LigA [Candidatus Liberibacter solanacearum]